MEAGSVEWVKLTVLVDNNDWDGFRGAWGIAILVETPKKLILFDTGPSPTVLRANAEKAGVNLSNIDIVVFSHFHRDHTGGYWAILLDNPGVESYGPPGTPADNIVLNTTVIAPGIILLEPLYGPPWESALAINVSGYGVVLLVGCSHTGVDRLVEEAIDVLGEPVRFVIGGFHTLGAPIGDNMRIVSRLRELGVEKAAPIHCSGDIIKRVIGEMYPDMLIEAHVGTVILVDSSGPRILQG
ncbi:MBL fold metallo-hydrolase [Hyperthermus butylicus]|uniref:Metal-dependent hydrolase of the beta-lactamase superfamily II n=1 Tax=Hyperthermus butylicus (strain DSM 5456 / JCM 9403 / PLM1-5) TaxID=415426 RepID=A2BJI7_HYPBU|nr:MBL fold metallo-hydrolase [Hyperthermus butylicus]ABM80148.1 Metal-dependent hydrolase of the beta-lactamase superfamily II [Hyperthermus butylicus DSM 5456]